MQIDEQLLNSVLEATNESRFLDAYNLAITAGAIQEWTGEAGLLAGRLAGHIGNRELYWSLTARAWRQYPDRTKFLTQRVYALTEKRGALAAWHESQKLSHSISQSDAEIADGLVCQGAFSLYFRDFESAKEYFSKASSLQPTNPWVLSESSEIFSAAGAHQKALEVIDEALAINPNYRSAVLRKAECLLKLQRQEESIQLLEGVRTHVQSAAVLGKLISIHSEKENWGYLPELIDEAERLAPLADKSFRSWAAAMRLNAFMGLGRLQDARQQALKIQDNRFYEGLADRLEKRADPNRRVKINVPYVQQDHNTCAPATLSAITSYLGKPIPQETIIGEICYDGTYDFVERRWADRNGWFTREFRVTWDSAVGLLDKGIPFVLSTTEISSAHSQAVIGYDEIRRTLLIREPNSPTFEEMGYEDFKKHYDPVGPRGFVLVPLYRASEIKDLPLQDSELYDISYALNCSLDENDRAGAKQHLAKLETTAPDHLLMWMGRRAIAFYDCNQLALLESLEGLARLYPADDRVLYLRINVLRSLGNVMEASRLLQDRCQKPKVPAIFWREYAAEKGFEKGNERLAFRLHWRSVKWESYNVDSLVGFAQYLWDRNHRDQALGFQRLAVCIGEKKEYAAETYFQMLQASGRTEEGLDFLRQRVDENIKKSPDPTITLVNILDRLNRSSEAKELLERASKERPSDGRLQTQFARFEGMSGHPEKCKELLDKAYEQTNPLPWLRAAASLEHLLGGFEQALTHYQNIVEISPLDYEAHSRITWLIARKEGKAAGRAYVRKLGERFPFHRQLLMLELEWTRTDFPDEAESRLRRYLQNNPRDAWAHRELAIVLHARASFDEALISAAKGKELEPLHPASSQVESMVLMDLGRTSEAKDSLKRLLETDINCDFAQRRLLACADSYQEKKETIIFIRDQLHKQPHITAAIETFRALAFPILDIAELTAEIKGLWNERPDIIEAWIAWTKQLAACGKLHEAKKVALEGTQRFSMSTAVWSNAATACLRQNDLDEAKRCLLEALKINPDITDSICELVGIYRRENRVEEAITFLERAIQRNPLDVVLLGTKAEIRWQAGAAEEAIEIAQKCVELSPDYIWAWNSLHRWSLVYRNDSPALALAQERAQRLGNDASAWLLVSQIATVASRQVDALNAALKARECEPRNVDAHDAVILALVAVRRFDEAYECCRTSSFGDYIPVELRGREAWLYSRQEKITTAIEKMRLVVESDPNYLWGWGQLAEWFCSETQFKDALEAIERVIRISPLDDQSYTTRARIFMELDRPHDAEADYLRAVALHPGNVFAGWQLFRLQLKRSALDSAQETADLIRNNVPTSISIAADALLAVGQHEWDDATALLSRLCVEPQEDRGVFSEILKAFDNGGEKRKADRILEEAVRNVRCNPSAAILWAQRSGITGSKRFGRLKRLPKDSPALVELLLYILSIEERSNRLVPLLNKIVSSHRTASTSNTVLWGEIGRLYQARQQFRKAARWLSDWRTRQGVQGYMVTNYVYALQSLGKAAEADLQSTDMISYGIADHSEYVHRLYLALSAVERGDGKMAREHFELANHTFDTENDRYFKTLVEQTLLVHEATPGRERKEAAARARFKVNQYRQRSSGMATFRLEKRISYQIAKDARDMASRWDAIKSFSRIPKIRIAFPSVQTRYAVFFCLILVNVVRFFVESNQSKTSAPTPSSTPANVQIATSAPSQTPQPVNLVAGMIPGVVQLSQQPSPQGPIPQSNPAVPINSEQSPPSTRTKTLPDSPAEILALANSGRVDAQRYYGWLLLKGEGVPKDIEQGCKWVLKAAEAGDAEAQTTVSSLYREGVGFTKNIDEATKWMKLAAEQGSPLAEHMMGVACFRGEGVPKDLKEAEKWWARSAQQGCDVAKAALAELHSTSKDFINPEGDKIQQIIHKAEQGDPVAQKDLAMAMLRGIGVPLDPQKAIELFKSSAEHGNAESQKLVGLAYQEGNIVPKDMTQCLYWLKKAAEQGDILCQNAIGNIYWTGDGAEKNPNEAYKWYKKAALKGEPFAQCNMGFFYENGIVVPKDPQKAIEWYRKAANQGNQIGFDGIKRLSPNPSQ